MEFKKLKLKDGSEYEVAFDDKCFVIETFGNVWISKSLIKWMNDNYEKERKDK